LNKTVFSLITAFILLTSSHLSAKYKFHINNTSSTRDSSVSNTEKYYHLIKEFTLGWHDEYETPYFVLLGKHSNPKMLIHGGMHGDEIAGYLACDTLIKNINLLEGTLIVIPRLNIEACRLDRRYINIDLNHAFPGDIGSDIYEFRLAYEMMWLIDSIKPDIIINLHEALTKYDSQARDDSDKAFGQILITCVRPYEDILTNSLYGMNEKIPRQDYKFNIHYYSFHDYSSMDNFIAKFNIKSYTVETYRGFTLGDRIKLQLTAVLQFMREAGLKYEYPEIKF
jgi:hypothetical protein